MGRGNLKRMRFAPFALVVGIASAAVLGFSAVGTVSGFSATINNSNNTANTASLSMKETLGGTTCLSTDGNNVSTNSSTCSTINKYGGTAGAGLTPNGTAVVTTVNIYNTGSATPSAFTLTPSACAQSANSASTGSATDLCANITLTITCGSSNVSVFSGTLATFTTGGAIAIPSKSATCVPVAGGSTPVPFTFTVNLASGAGNTYQNLSASQPMAWSFSA